MIGSPTIDGNRTPTLARALPANLVAADHPGRWLGGLMGAVASMAVGVAAQVVMPADASSDAAMIGILGIPIGFILGRAFWPQARSGDRVWALWVGAGIGLLAPPLGAIEIMLGPALVPPNPATTSYALPAAVLFLMIAIPFSYIAVVVTVPAGLVWATLVRLIPEDAPSRLRAPKAIERLGVRHALLVLLVWGLVIQLATGWSR